jgi:hypothetical protein
MTAKALLSRGAVKGSTVMLKNFLANNWFKEYKNLS